MTRLCQAALILPLLVGVASACSRSPQAPPSQPRDRPRDPLPAEQPQSQQAAASSKLSQLNVQLQNRIRDRWRWRQGILDNPAASSEDKTEATGELANLLHSYELYEDAQALYLEAQQRAPDDFRWPYYLGQVHRRGNEPELSIASFERALELSPDDVPALVNLAEVLVDQDRREEAQRLFDKALTLDAECAAAHFGMAQVAVARRQLESAIVHFERVLELDPEASAVHNPLGLALRDLGQKDLARSHLEAAGTTGVALRDPLMSRLYVLSEGLRLALVEGRERLEAGEASAAIEPFERAVLADPLFEPRLFLGSTLQRVGRVQEALQQLELAVRLSPTSPEARFRLASLLLESGQPEAAVEHYRTGLARAPEIGWAHYELASALARLGQQAEALAEYRRAIELEPQRRRARLGEATVLQRTGRCAQARERIEEALEELPRDGALGHALARLLAGCPEETARDGGRALSLALSLFEALPSPGHAEAVAMALAESGRFVEAVDWQKRAVSAGARDGSPELDAVLRTNLRLFEAGRPSRTPWLDEAVFSVGQPGAGPPSVSRSPSNG